MKPLFSKVYQKSASFLQAILIKLIVGYQRFISPFLGANCRFYPTCSSYTRDSLQQWGVLKGSVLAIKRLCKCHPWHPGGIDLVPSKPITKLSSSCYKD